MYHSKVNRESLVARFESVRFSSSAVVSSVEAPYLRACFAVPTDITAQVDNIVNLF
jgi:hypothetical protein